MENSIQLHVPVTIPYTALKGMLQQQVVGHYIPDPNKSGDESAYGQVLDVAIAGSRLATYDVAVALKIRILRTLLKRDNVDLLVYAALGYDNDRQLVYVRKYKVEVKTQSGFYNTALEVLANNVAYEKVMKKARVAVGDKLAQEVNKVNAMLAEGKEVKGVRLTGTVTQARVEDITAHPEHLSLSVLLSGAAQVEVLDLAAVLAAAKESQQ